MYDFGYLSVPLFFSVDQYRSAPSMQNLNGRVATGSHKKPLGIRVYDSDRDVKHIYRDRVGLRVKQWILSLVTGNLQLSLRLLSIVDFLI